MTETDQDAFPQDAHQLRSADDVATAIAGMAADISSELGDQDPIVMPILIGGAFTALKLCEHFLFPYEIDTVRVARYGPYGAGELHWYSRPCLDLSGRQVLLVDDVLDRGVTLHAVEHELRRMDAAGVSLAVLVRKRVDPDVRRPAVDYVGIDVADEYLFGCGMDLDGRWRGLPALYGIRGETRGTL
jgi:hypoxanthine phosphoribosyltransferase